MKMPKPEMTPIKVLAVAVNCQGLTASPSIPSRTAPRLMLIYFGAKPARTMPVDTPFKMTLIDNWAQVHPKPAKKTAARTPDESP
jgi:hypothetical protein